MLLWFFGLFQASHVHDERHLLSDLEHKRIENKFQRIKEAYGIDFQLIISDRVHKPKNNQVIIHIDNQNSVYLTAGDLVNKFIRAGDLNSNAELIQSKVIELTYDSLSEAITSITYTWYYQYYKDHNDIWILRIVVTILISSFLFFIYKMQKSMQPFKEFYLKQFYQKKKQDYFDQFK